MLSIVVRVRTIELLVRHELSPLACSQAEACMQKQQPIDHDHVAIIAQHKVTSCMRV